MGARTKAAAILASSCFDDYLDIDKPASVPFMYVVLFSCNLLRTISISSIKYCRPLSARCVVFINSSAVNVFLKKRPWSFFHCTRNLYRNSWKTMSRHIKLRAGKTGNGRENHNDFSSLAFMTETFNVKTAPVVR